MLISFQDMHFWAIFCHNFSHSTLKFLNPIPGRQTTLDFKNILIQVFFTKKQVWANLQQNYRKSIFFWTSLCRQVLYFYRLYCSCGPSSRHSAKATQLLM